MSEIRYRVADFLKRQPPFNAVDDADLLRLVERGRVKFYEPNEYVIWQGEPHKPFVFVIQQGTVSLWDEAPAVPVLQDVRGAGDMLGLERYLDARSCLYSARSESDVVVYALPADDFEDCVLKYPHAAQYVAAEGRASPDYQVSAMRREPQGVFVHDVAGHRPLATCPPTASIRDVSQALLSGAAEAIAVLGADRQATAVITAETILRWVVDGAGDAGQSLDHLLPVAPAVIGPEASVADGVLAMAHTDATALAVTTDGQAHGPLLALVTARDLSALFGEQPSMLLRHVRRATTIGELRDAHARARAFILEFLVGPGSVGWLTRFTQSVDAAVMRRLIDIAGGDEATACWCFCDTSGRGESLTALAPSCLVVLADGADPRRAQQCYGRVNELFEACGYLRPTDLPFDAAFMVAPAEEWTSRFRGWISDPVIQGAYRARRLFDLRPVHGAASFLASLEVAIGEATDRNFLHIMANDCLSRLPPISFFEDTVVDSVGEHNSLFQLEQSALRPLVDVGRVFGLASRMTIGRSTLDRFDVACTLLPEHASIFREASDTLRIVLWQQGRVGISQGTRGDELPPSLLSRHDRQVLKGGFRSIRRLLQFTADGEWLGQL